MERIDFVRQMRRYVGLAALIPSSWRHGRTNLESNMSWKTPKIAEVCVGMEINMYACATRK